MIDSLPIVCITGQVNAHLIGGDAFQEIVLERNDFSNYDGEPLTDWRDVRRLKLTDTERLRSRRSGSGDPKQVGKDWNGTPPQFRSLRWRTPDTPKESS